MKTIIKMTSIIREYYSSNGYYSEFVKEQAASWHDLSYASGGRGYAW